MNNPYETLQQLTEALPAINSEIKAREKRIPVYKVNKAYRMICILLIVALTIFDLAINLDLYKLIFSDEYGQISLADWFLIAVKSVSYLSAIVFIKLLMAQLFKRANEVFIFNLGKSELFWQSVITGIYVIGFLVAIYVVYHVGRAAVLPYTSNAIITDDLGIYSVLDFGSDTSKIAWLLPLSAMGIGVLWGIIEYQSLYKKPMHDFLCAERDELEKCNQLIAESYRLEQEIIKCSSQSHIQSKAVEGFDYSLALYKEELFEGSVTSLFSNAHAGVNNIPDVVDGIETKVPNDFHVFTNPEQLQQQTEQCKQSIEDAYQYLSQQINQTPTYSNHLNQEPTS